MIGELVPLVMIPRFTSYVGPSSYSTNPLDVSEYVKANLEFWRGVLQGDTFTAYFEEASEQDPPGGWTVIDQVTTDDDNDLLELELTKRFFRIRIVLTPDAFDLCAITCWAAGNLERRIPGSPGG